MIDVTVAGHLYSTILWSAIIYFLILILIILIAANKGVKKGGILATAIIGMILFVVLMLIGYFTLNLWIGIIG